MEHDRRTALGLVAGAGVGSALILTACARKGGDEDKEGGGATAAEDLMREHGVLRRVLIL